jgi:ribosomal protein S6--L-glutamate ligase
MSGGLHGLRVGLLERPSRAGEAGRLVDDLAPLLRDRGASVRVVDADRRLHRLDQPPSWDIVILKSGGAMALHLAAAAEAHGIPSLNSSEATRLAQDRIAVAAILGQAELPVPDAWLVWVDATQANSLSLSAQLGERPRIVKAARGSRGSGLWWANAGELGAVAATLPTGPYLVMDWIEHDGEDLKVFVAGQWMTAIERRFPAINLVDKRGRPAPLPVEVGAAARAVGRILGLSCFGCDFVRGKDGWVLVDVNPFPGYKGAAGAAEAIATEVARLAQCERPA